MPFPSVQFSQSKPLRQNRWVVSDLDVAPDLSSSLQAREVSHTSPASADQSPASILEAAHAGGARYLFVAGSADFTASWLEAGCVDRIALLLIPKIRGRVIGRNEAGPIFVRAFQPQSGLPRIAARLVHLKQWSSASDRKLRIGAMMLAYYSLIR